MPELTGLPALDVAIGLALMYLLLSLFLSAVQETVAAILNWRATMLEEGIRNLLAGAPPGPVAVGGAGEGSTEGAAPAGIPAGVARASGVTAANELYRNPFILALYRKSSRGLFRRTQKPRLPSYIAPRTFALALLDTFAPNAAAPTANASKSEHDIIKGVRTAIDGNTLLPVGTKRALISILDQARGDLDKVRHGIEAWFDDSMARVSGWYKRKTQIVLCILAATVAVGLNVDSVVVARTLWRDPALREVVVQAATKPGGVGETGKLPGDTPADRAANGLESVKKLNLPIGWSKNPNDPRHVSLRNHGLAKLAGWLITFMALSFGAPFWFDTLSRLSRLRNSGKPEAPLSAPGRGLPNERVG